MKCSNSNCENIIKKSHKCNLCPNIFCSNNCILEHFSKYHTTLTSNLLSNINNFSQKITLKKLELKSKYISEGKFSTSKIKYDSIYNLNNFVKLTKNGKNIILGQGTYGQVYLTENIINHKFYAIKHMDKEKLKKHVLNPIEAIYNEIDIQSRISHKNIIKLFNVNETIKSFDLIMEYANNGTLFHYIKRNKGLNEKLSFKFFIQICNAIFFLHKNNLMHRDIKPENILMFDDNLVKLGDFGWCVEIETKTRSTFCGTIEYMAPEIVNQINYDQSIDIWSLGILLYELIHGFSPFRAVKNKFNDDEVIDNIKENKIVFERNVSFECKELILELLNKNEKKRISIEDVFMSKWVKKFEFEGFFVCLGNFNLDFERKIKRNESQSNFNFIKNKISNNIGKIKELQRQNSFNNLNSKNFEEIKNNNNNNIEKNFNENNKFLNVIRMNILKNKLMSTEQFKKNFVDEEKKINDNNNNNYQTFESFKLLSNINNNNNNNNKIFNEKRINKFEFKENFKDFKDEKEDERDKTPEKNILEGPIIKPMKIIKDFKKFIKNKTFHNKSKTLMMGIQNQLKFN